MTEQRFEKDYVWIETSKLKDAADGLIAASGLVAAVAAEHASTGVLPAGALRYIAIMIDNQIDLLGLADIEGDQETLPF